MSPSPQDRPAEKSKVESLLLCRICGSPVPLETSKTDGDGKAIHDQCYILKVKSEQASGMDMGPSRASILIVDDVSEWRAHVHKILEKQNEWQIVGEACDGLQAAQRAAELEPDLVLLDIGMPVLSGLEAAAQIQQSSPNSKIVFLTQENDADIRGAADKAGADGYVLKADAARELLSTITDVLGNAHRAN